MRTKQQPSRRSVGNFGLAPSDGKLLPLIPRISKHMSPETHSQLANFIWSICNLLRGPYKRNEYRKVILPLTVLRRFDCLLAATKPAVRKEQPALKAKPETVIRHRLQQITGRAFYNLSKL